MNPYLSFRRFDLDDRDLLSRYRQFEAGDVFVKQALLPALTPLLAAAVPALKAGGLFALKWILPSLAVGLGLNYLTNNSNAAAAQNPQPQPDGTPPNPSSPNPLYGLSLAERIRQLQGAVASNPFATALPSAISNTASNVGEALATASSAAQSVIPHPLSAANLAETLNRAQRLFGNLPRNPFASPTATPTPAMPPAPLPVPAPATPPAPAPATPPAPTTATPATPPAPAPMPTTSPTPTAAPVAGSPPATHTPPTR